MELSDSLEVEDVDKVCISTIKIWDGNFNAFEYTKMSFSKLP